MRLGGLFFAAWMVAISVAVRAVDVGTAQSAIQQPPVVVTSPEAARALLDQYCVSCHNQRLKTGGLALDVLDPTNVGPHAREWEKVIVKLQAGLMPPGDRARPDKPTLQSFLSWLGDELDRSWAAHPDPGRTEPFHRLNRAEYANAIRDLLAVQIDVSEMLPVDEISYGFDNIAGVLKLSPLLMERYLNAAQKIARVATGTPGPPTGVMVRVSDQLDQDIRLDGMPVGTRGGTLVNFMAPRDGEYVIKARLGRGLDEDIPHFRGDQDLEISIDGEQVAVFTLKASPDWDLNIERQVFRAPSQGPETGTARKGGRLPEQEMLDRRKLDDDWVVRVPMTAGAHEVRATFPVKSPSALPEGFRRPFLKPYVGRGIPDTRETREGAALRTLEIMGPLLSGGADQSLFRKRVFVCQPSKPAEEPGCAKTILSTLGRRAYRRPVTTEDVQLLLDIYAKARSEGRTFDQGIEVALQRVLISPSFLFRTEFDPARADASAPGVYRISDVSLASRLSFFLWSSIPDDALLDVAIQGRLHEPAVLEQQVRRMLKDPRSEALVKNFAGQWLYLRKLPDIVPDPMIYPDFGDTLAQALARETELFFDSVMRDDRPAMELLTGNYTFVNERLARHYGIPNIRGIDFQRITLPDDSPRLGLLGKGSVLTVTSFPNRTSPVVRGKWVLENILGAPPPEPPPVVPPFPEEQNIGRLLTIRQKTEQHRKNPVCASCHRLMEPLGFTLENFDAIGKYRVKDDDFLPIDSIDTYADGTKMEGVAGLRRLLVNHSDRFLATLTSKLLTYSLGRGIEASDMPAVRAILRDAASNEYRFQSLILGIVKSAPFQMRRMES